MTVNKLKYLIITILLTLLLLTCFLHSVSKTQIQSNQTIKPKHIHTYESQTEIIINPTIYSQASVAELKINKVTQEISNPTLYDTFTEEEINLIEVVVQHEVGAFSDEYKKLIAELIYNRFISEDFPNTISEVLYQKNQFCGIERWYSPDFEVDDNTKQVVKKVFSQEETSHQATYYYNPKLSDYKSIMWFEYSGDVEYLFEHTEEDWGIEYTTRFFK